MSKARQSFAPPPRFVQAGRALRDYPVTVAFAILLCGAYALQATVDPDPDFITFLRLGATAGWLLMEGELFRLACASFVQANPIHFSTVTLGTLVLAAPIERNLGSQRTLLIAIAGGTSGNIVASLVGDRATLGASGFAYGLMGGFAVFCARSQPRGWIVPVAFGAGIALESFLVPWGGEISLSSHLGGALGGALACILSEPGSGRLEGARLRRWTAVVAAMEIALLGWGGVALSRWDDRALLRAARHLYERADPEPIVVAELVQWAHRSPAATDRDRLSARAALQRVLASSPPVPLAYELEARLLAQEGREREAIRQLHEAFALTASYAQAQELARLELRHHEELAAVDAVTAAVGPDGTWGLRVETALGRGCEWHLLALEGETARGYVRLRLGRDTANPVTLALHAPAWLAETRWYTTHRRCVGVEAGARDALFWPLDSLGPSAQEPGADLAGTCRSGRETAEVAPARSRAQPRHASGPGSEASRPRRSPGSSSST